MVINLPIEAGFYKYVIVVWSGDNCYFDSYTNNYQKACDRAKKIDGIIV